MSVQPDLFTSAPPALESLPELLKRDSRCAKLARLFLAHRGEWIDARRMAEVAGFCGWRTRAAELNHHPWNLTIETRLRKTENGVVISERRLV